MRHDEPEDERYPYDRRDAAQAAAEDPEQLNGVCEHPLQILRPSLWQA